jgi:predicted ester cyclase
LAPFFICLEEVRPIKGRDRQPKRCWLEGENEVSIEQNKAAVYRLYEVVQKRDWAALPDLIAPDYVYHMDQEIRGPEGLKQMFTGLIAAFPDYREQMERVVAEGDLVAVTYMMSGTFTGRYSGIAPTGKKFTVPRTVVARFENGKQVEAWGYSDSLALFQQLGIKPPGQ